MSDPKLGWTEHITKTFFHKQNCCCESSDYLQMKCYDNNLEIKVKEGGDGGVSIIFCNNSQAAFLRDALNEYLKGVI